MDLLIIPIVLIAIFFLRMAIPPPQVNHPENFEKNKNKLKKIGRMSNIIACCSIILFCFIT